MEIVVGHFTAAAAAVSCPSRWNSLSLSLSLGDQNRAEGGTTELAPSTTCRSKCKHLCLSRGEIGNLSRARRRRARILGATKGE
jgi:hypothetical protein